MNQLTTGKRWDSLVSKITDWSQQVLAEMIEGLQQDYPPRSQKLSPYEQYTRFLTMTPQDYMGLIATLRDKYHGLPNADDLVNKELASYMQHMIALSLTQGQQGQTTPPLPTEPTGQSIPNPPGYLRVVRGQV